MKTPSPESDHQDRQFLTDLANYLSRSVGWMRPLQKLSVRCEASDTGGWFVHLARARVGRDVVHFDLWLDRFTHSGQRRLWFGYSWTNLRAFDRTIGDHISHVPEDHLLESADFVYDRDTKAYRLRSGIPNRELPLVMVERYRSPSWCFLGVYLEPDVRKSTILSRIENTLFATTLLMKDGVILVPEELFWPNPPETWPAPPPKKSEDTIVTLRLGGGFGSPEENKKTEVAAINAASRYLQRQGWTVQSRERERVGYDLECRRGKSTMRVEVKGVRGTAASFILTAGEYERAMKDFKFALCVVTSALKSPVVRLVKSGSLHTKLTVVPLAYKAQLSA